MSDKDLSLDDLVRAQRQSVGLAPRRLRHNRKLLMARLAGAAAGGAAFGVSSAAAATGKLASGLGKLVVAVSLVGAVGGGYYLSRPAASEPFAVRQVRGSSGESSGPRAQQPAVGAVETRRERPESESAAPAELPSKPGLAPKAPAAKAESAEGPAAESSLSDDVRLMQQVGQALEGGRAEQALELLKRGPGQDAGAMREEKAAARVVTLCRLGRVAEARAEAASFQKKYPRSPLSSRVRSSCAKTSSAGD